jgi:hypothetical protein
MFDVSPVLSLIYSVAALLAVSAVIATVSGLLARGLSKQRRLAVVNLVFILSIVIGAFTFLLPRITAGV